MLFPTDGYDFNFVEMRLIFWRVERNFRINWIFVGEFLKNFGEKFWRKTGILESPMPYFPDWSFSVLLAGLCHASWTEACFLNIKTAIASHM